MKRIVRNMIELYKLEEICFLGYKLDETATFHHINKKSYGGSDDIKNGAVVNPYGHDYLHVIEYREPELYSMISILLKKENEQGLVSSQYLRTISEIMKEFEKKHMNDISARGHKVIKKEYLKRIYY